MRQKYVEREKEREVNETEIHGEIKKERLMRQKYMGRERKNKHKNERRYRESKI